MRESSGACKATSSSATARITSSSASTATTLWRGRGGDDILHGDFADGGNATDGNDILTGGAGTDGFLFNTALNAASNVDTITDFSIADFDGIILHDAISTGVVGDAVTTNLLAQQFRIGAAAADADDRIIYNDVTGALSFDVDGVGGTADVQFATLSASLAMTNVRFFVI